jgi:hypothetical protein
MPIGSTAYSQRNRAGDSAPWAADEHANASDSNRAEKVLKEAAFTAAMVNEQFPLCEPGKLKLHPPQNGREVTVCGEAHGRILRSADFPICCIADF